MTSKAFKTKGNLVNLFRFDLPTCRISQIVNKSKRSILVGAREYMLAETDFFFAQSKQ